jgi:3-hydroxybutyryl-CoA dehydrogenase
MIASDSSKPGAVSTIVVAGAGVMGRGIAHVAALSGADTRLFDVAASQLEGARAAIEANLRKGVDKGKLPAASANAALSRLTLHTELAAACDGADLLIEAVPEQLALKLALLEKAQAQLPTHAVIATNTSALSITEVCACLRDPGRGIGMHFFNPVHLMQLVEVVRGLATRESTQALAMDVARRMGKTPVEVNEAPGFVTTRVNAMIGNEAFFMLQEGVASARDIDTALKLGLNHPMGPFELVDLVGLDTRLSILQYLHRTLGEKFRPCPLLEKYVKAGRLGRKVGRGVYEYDGPGGKAL